VSLAVFAVLAIAHTWPLAAAPSHWSRTDPGDGALNIWAVSWVGWTLTHHPSRLFEANIFYPEHLTLAYSEAMVVQGLFAAPVLAFGGSAVLAYNVALVAGLALTGWAFCLLVRRWTGSWSAGYVAGSLAAFNAYSMVHLTHMQFLHVEFFALMLYALDRLIVSGRATFVWLLAAGFVLQALTSIYLMVFSIWSLLFAVLSRAGEWWRGGARLAARLAAAGAIAVLLLAPYLAGYVIVHAQKGFARSADEAEAAGWINYLSTGARVHYDWWSKPFIETATAATFPGIVALALIVVAVSDRDVVRDPRFRMCAVVAGGCAAVSMAPLLPFYRQLHDAIPLFQIVRVLANLGQVVLLMVAVLAGFGVAALQHTWRHARSWPAAAVAVTILVNAEALRAPIGYVWFEGVPPVYDVLAAEPNAVIVEVPFPMPQQWFLNTPYMVNSTRHWRPMLNGYSGFRPTSYYQSYEAMRAFPSDQSLITLHERGVTHIVIHQRAFEEGLGAARFNELALVPTLQQVARDGDIVIYRLRRQ
jgi:hypothetical protein